MLAALSFVVVCCFGGAGSMWLVFQMQQHAALATSAQAHAFANSVARTLAGQFENAVNHGAPLEQIPRTEAYLEKIQRSTPGVSQITLKNAEGKTLATTQNRAVDQAAVASVPVVGPGQTVGAVEVQVTTTQFGQQKGLAIWLLPLAVVSLAALTAALVAWVVARAATRADALLNARLPHAMVLTPLAGNEFAEKPGDDPWQATLDRLLVGDAQLQDKLTSFENLAQEMLAVDFDDQLAPRIEAIRAHALRAFTKEAG